MLPATGLTAALPLFALATAVVALVAPRLAKVADQLGTRTGIGNSLAGAVFLGACTSVPGLVVTVSATLRGDVELAAANAVGGVAAQTTFLALADVAYRRGSLTRDAVSPRALSQVALLLVLLAVPLLAVSGYPDATVLDRVHPASLVLLVAYPAGMWVARRQPRRPGEDEGGRDSDSDEGRPSLAGLWLRLAGYASVVGVAGYLISTQVGPIADSIGLTTVAAGALLTAAATSSPELLTAISAARRGRPALAVGDIVGGNNFDLLFLAVADLVLAGSLYADLGPAFPLLIGVAVLLNAALLLGFVRGRPERRVSPPNVLVLALYVALAVLLVVSPPPG